MGKVSEGKRVRRKEERRTADSLGVLDSGHGSYESLWSERRERAEEEEVELRSEGRARGRSSKGGTLSLLSTQWREKAGQRQRRSLSSGANLQPVLQDVDGEERGKRLRTTRKREERRRRKDEGEAGERESGVDVDGERACRVVVE
jgi:hypothetical protein